MDSKIKIEKMVSEALTKIENSIDTEIERYNDIDHIREERLKTLKAEHEQHKMWLSKDHGTYYEIEEKEFFQICKNSIDVVAHFFTNNSELCEVFDNHLKILAKQHIETRFIKINSEKAPFLMGRLDVKIIPTIILIKDNQPLGKLIGLTKLDNNPNFNTDLLEWRVAQYKVIKYGGDINVRPDEQRNKVSWVSKKSSIRQGGRDKDDSECEDLY